MSPLAKSSLKSAAHIGCRIALWQLVVIPALVVVARAAEEEDDDPYLLIPRMLFMFAVALLTIRYLGRYFKAGNIVYVCFETAVAVLMCYVALTVIWANVETIGYLLLHLYSYLLEVIWDKGLDEDNIDAMELIMTTALAFSFLMWVLFSGVESGPGYSVRFSSVVEVRFIVPQSHQPHRPTTELINAPGDPGRNPIVQASATPPSTTGTTGSWYSAYSSSTLASSHASGCSSSTSQSTDGLLESVLEFLNDRTT